MTAQFSDTVTYRDEDFTLAGINGEGLFDPERQGMKPIGRCSACWRGFVCGYLVAEDRLTLEELQICLDGPAPDLFGRQPDAGPPGRRLRLFDAYYRNVGHAVPFTGGLLIARDFIRDLYVHMGFHPAWKYRIVHELIFDDGNLLREADRSAEIAELREEIANRPMEPGHRATREEIKRWVEQCFSRDYKW